MNTIRTTLSMVLLLVSSWVWAQPSHDDIIQMVDRKAKQVGIPSFIVVSVISHESGDPKNEFFINPNALNIKGRSYYPATKSKAYALIVNALTEGKDSVGVGIGQVEWKYHDRSFVSLWEALDPEKNLDVTLGYLKEMIEYCDGVYSCGVAAYHNRNKSIGKKYLGFVARRCVALYGDKKCEVLDAPF